MDVMIAEVINFYNYTVPLTVGNHQFTFLIGCSITEIFYFTKKINNNYKNKNFMNF